MIPWEPVADPMGNITLWYGILVYCNWIYTRWLIVQYTLTHKQYTEQHNETQYLERNTSNKKNT